MTQSSSYWARRSRLLAAGAVVLAACAAPSKVNVHETSRAPVVHTVTGSPLGLLVNAYLVEGAHGVIIVDSALTVSDAAALREALDALHKPLVAVLLTHGHPDHYNGVSALLSAGSDVPVYATQAVSEVIRSSDASKEAQWKPMFGAEWPAQRVFPTHVVADGQTLSLDGLKFTVHAVGPGESHADSYWVLDSDEPQVFVGDIVLHGVHAYVADGHTSSWLATLRDLQGELSARARLYPGHGAAGGIELLAWQTGYLETYRSELMSQCKESGVLTEADKAQLTASMKARYPQAGLEFLIALGADAVVSELCKNPSSATSTSSEPGT